MAREHWIFFDTETSRRVLPSGDVVVDPYLIGWCSYLLDGKSFKQTTPFCWDTMNHETGRCEVFLNFLKSFERCKSVVLCGYNAQYDLQVIYHNHLKPHLGKLRSKFNIENNLINFVFMGKRIKFRVVDLQRWDSSNSLADYTRFIDGCELKGTIDYEKWNCCQVGDKFAYSRKPDSKTLTVPVKDEVEYLRKDVEALPKVFSYFRQQQEIIFNEVKIPYPRRFYYPHHQTLSAFSKFVASEYFGGNDVKNKGILFDTFFRPKVSKRIYDIMMQSSIGGYVTFNKEILSYEGKIETFDVNSMHPSIMCGELPCGPLLNKKKLLKNPKAFVKWCLIRVNSCYWKEEYKMLKAPSIPRYKWKNSGIFIPQDELNELKQWCDIDYVYLRSFWQDTTTALKPLMEKCFERKSDPKNSWIVRDTMKLFLNAQYGKLYEKSYEVSKVLDGLSFWFQDASKPTYRSMMTGLFIVYRSRNILMREIIRQINNGNHFLYADTDSIKLGVVKPVVIENLDDSKMGYWRNDGVWTHFRCNGKARKYFLWNSKNKKGFLALSGISRKFVEGLQPPNNKWNEKHAKKLLELLDDKNNPLFVGGKITHQINHIWQQVLAPIDIEFNKGKKITHKVTTNCGKMMMVCV